MMLLVLVVLLNAYIFVVFKLFPKYNIDAFQAIAINYWACYATGLFLQKDTSYLSNLGGQSWLPYAILLGVLLISLFNVISYSTKKEGMTVTTIATKLSLVIPVVFAYYLYSDDIGWLKVAGILLAIPAVYFATIKKGERLNVRHLSLPITIFIAAGLFDTYLKYMQNFHLATQVEQANFTTTGFMFAGLLGTLVAVYMVYSGKAKLAFRNLVAGVLLGIPNYFSVYLFIRLLDTSTMRSSAVIPVNNISIVLCTTIIAAVFFEEKLSKYRFAGIALSILSIILIAVSDLYG